MIFELHYLSNEMVFELIKQKSFIFLVYLLISIGIDWWIIVSFSEI